MSCSIRWLHATIVAVSLALILAPSTAVTAFAQTATATLTGVIVDETAAILSGVRVTVLNAETRLERTASTNGEGLFVVPLLPPGRYTVLAEHDGFATSEVRDVILNVGDQLALRLRMKVAAVGETVNLQAGPAPVRTSAAVGTVVDRQFVENLPLNGRSFQSLIALTPGIVLVASTNTGPTDGQFSVNGQRASSNAFSVDGVSANFGTTPGGWGQSTTTGSLPGLTTFGTTQSLVSVDAMQEFKVQTSTYAAEHGRQPGGQISIVTRSGTNQFHGSLFDYVRNDVFDANDWFANRLGQPKPPMRQNDFGGTFGGPLRVPGYNGRNRSFFFFSYEGLRLRQPRVDVTNVPTLALRQQAPAGIQPLLNAFPLPNGRDLGNGFAEMTAAVSDPSTLNATSIRVDHALTNAIGLFARYNDSPSDTSATVAGGSLSVLSTRRLATRTLTIGSTAALTPKALNDFRINVSDNGAWLEIEPIEFGGSVLPPRSALIPAPFDSNSAQGNVLFVIPGRTATGVTQVNLAGRTNTSQRQFTVVDHFTYVAGAHQLKFGIDYRRITPISEFPSYTLQAQITSQADILAGRATSMTIRTNRRLEPVFQNFSGYAQDTWRLSRRLTLDAGVRWEVNPAPTEANGQEQLAVTQIDDLSTMQLQPLGTRPWETTWFNFGPRIGLAYQVSEAAGRETVVRGGFGVFHDTGNERGAANFTSANYPYSSTRNVSSVPYPLNPAQVAPGPAPIEAGLTTPHQSFYAMDPNLQLPYTLQWNVAIERSLGHAQTLTVSYVGAAGRRLLQSTQNNLTQINRDFSGVYVTTNGATSDYHSLQMQFQRRLSRGLQVLGAYTWSHAIDEDSTSNTYRVVRRGDANFDVRHVGTAAVTFDLPAPRTGRLAQSLLGGWSLDTTFNARSAMSVDVTGATLIDPFDGSIMTVRPNVVPGVPLYIDEPSAPGGRRINRAAFSIPATGQSGDLGRNALRGFGAWQIDAAIRRRFAVAGPVVLQLRAEAFNLFNRPNFGRIQTDLASANFGEATNMLNRHLGGLSQLYQLGGPRSVQFSARLSF